jgi:hypothetical protein
MHTERSSLKWAGSPVIVADQHLSESCSAGLAAVSLRHLIGLQALECSAAGVVGNL